MSPSTDPSTPEPARPRIGLPSNHELRQLQSAASHIAQAVDLPSLNVVARQVQEMQCALPPAAMREMMNQAAHAARAIMPLAGAMQQLHHTLDGCSAAVGGALASVAKMWSSISWPTLPTPELKTLSNSVAQIHELSEAYRQQRQRSIGSRALLPIARPQPRTFPSLEAKLVQQFNRLERRLQQLEQRPTEPDSPPDALAICRVVVDAKRRVAIITRGRQQVRMSLERAECRVLSRLIPTFPANSAKRGRSDSRRRWVSSKQLVCLFPTQSSSGADAADYLRKTISDLRGKMVRTLRQLGCAAERLDVIQCQRRPGYSYGFYRLGLSACKRLP